MVLILLSLLSHKILYVPLLQHPWQDAISPSHLRFCWTDGVVCRLRLRLLHSPQGNHRGGIDAKKGRLKSTAKTMDGLVLLNTSGLSLSLSLKLRGGIVASATSILSNRYKQWLLKLFLSYVLWNVGIFEISLVTSSQQHGYGTIFKWWFHVSLSFWSVASDLVVFIM